MNEITQRLVETNGIRLNVAEQGSGPLVLLCHGFPESWYSWRNQLGALAAAGYHAAAPDMRGYGKSDRPEEIDQYTLFHLVGDMVGLVEALGETRAVIVGHDLGARVAWHAALLRPDRFRAVAGLSVPFQPRGRERPTSAMPRTKDAQYYQLYFQEPGVAEAEFGKDPYATLRNLLYGASGDARRGEGDGIDPAMTPLGGPFLRGDPAPQVLPPWLDERDVAFYAGEFARTGFRGAFNWYRNIDRNWELSAPYSGATVNVPSLYLLGDRDFVGKAPGMDRLLPELRRFVPGLRKLVVIPGCGHWTQQERPVEVNQALVEFLRGLPLGGD